MKIKRRSAYKKPYSSSSGKSKEKEKDRPRKEKSHKLAYQMFFHNRKETFNASIKGLKLEIGGGSCEACALELDDDVYRYGRKSDMNMDKHDKDHQGEESMKSSLDFCLLLSIEEKSFMQKQSACRMPTMIRSEPVSDGGGSDSVLDIDEFFLNRDDSDSISDRDTGFGQS
ncbi:hypothetical protein CR513_03679, partial [Mucuna pruriens]